MAESFFCGLFLSADHKKPSGKPLAISLKAFITMESRAYILTLFFICLFGFRFSEGIGPDSEQSGGPGAPANQELEKDSSSSAQVLLFKNRKVRAKVVNNAKAKMFRDRKQLRDATDPKLQAFYADRVQQSEKTYDDAKAGQMVDRSIKRRRRSQNPGPRQTQVPPKQEHHVGPVQRWDQKAGEEKDRDSQDRQERHHAANQDLYRSRDKQRQANHPQGQKHAAKPARHTKRRNSEATKALERWRYYKKRAQDETKDPIRRAHYADLARQHEQSLDPARREALSLGIHGAKGGNNMPHRQAYNRAYQNMYRAIHNARTTDDKQEKARFKAAARYWEAQRQERKRLWDFDKEGPEGSEKKKALTPPADPLWGEKARNFATLAIYHQTKAAAATVEWRRQAHLEKAAESKDELAHMVGREDAEKELAIRANMPPERVPTSWPDRQGEMTSQLGKRPRQQHQQQSQQGEDKHTASQGPRIPPMPTPLFDPGSLLFSPPPTPPPPEGLSQSPPTGRTASWSPSQDSWHSSWASMLYGSDFDQGTSSHEARATPRRTTGMR